MASTHPPTTCPKIKQSHKTPGIRYLVFTSKATINILDTYTLSETVSITTSSVHLVKVIHIKFMLVVFTYKEWLLCIIVFLCLFSNRQKMRLLCLNLGLFFLEMYLFLFDSIHPQTHLNHSIKKEIKKEKESYQVVRFLVYSVYMPLNLHKSNHVPLSFPSVP